MGGDGRRKGAEGNRGIGLVTGSSNIESPDWVDELAFDIGREELEAVEVEPLERMVVSFSTSWLLGGEDDVGELWKGIAQQNGVVGSSIVNRDAESVCERISDG